MTQGNGRRMPQQYTDFERMTAIMEQPRRAQNAIPPDEGSFFPRDGNRGIDPGMAFPGRVSGADHPPLSDEEFERRLQWEDGLRGVGRRPQEVHRPDRGGRYPEEVAVTFYEEPEWYDRKRPWNGPADSDNAGMVWKGPYMPTDVPDSNAIALLTSHEDSSLTPPGRVNGADTPPLPDADFERAVAAEEAAKRKARDEARTPYTVADRFENERKAGERHRDAQRKADEELKRIQSLPEDERKYTAGQMIRSAGQNLGPSALQFGSDIYAAVTDPVETLKNGAKIVSGAASYAAGIESGHREYADRAGQYIKDNYGSVDKAMRTFAENPVGFLADASMALSAGGGVLRGAGKLAQVAGKTAGKAAISADAGKTGKIASTIEKGARSAGEVLTDLGRKTSAAGAALDPVAMPVKGAVEGVKALGKDFPAISNSAESLAKGGKWVARTNTIGQLGGTIKAIDKEQQKKK